MALLRNGAADGQEQAARAPVAGPAATPPTRPRSVRPAASRRRRARDAARRPAARKQAAWAFSRLAHDNAANRVAIREAGGIPPVVALVRRGAADCQEAAVMALGNLAYNNPANQAAIVAAGAVGPLVALVRVGAIRLGGHSREAEWALENARPRRDRLAATDTQAEGRAQGARARAAAARGPGEECVVCFERARAVAFLPSGHFCVCSKCGQRASECPICRKSTRKQRIRP